MKTEIHRLSLRMGRNNCYLVKEDGIIMVDAGTPKHGKKLPKWLDSLSIKPGYISLLLLTHGHIDHIGSESEFKKLTGCKVAINHREKDWVEKALKAVPPLFASYQVLFISYQILFASHQSPIRLVSVPPQPCFDSSSTLICLLLLLFTVMLKFTFYNN